MFQEFYGQLFGRGLARILGDVIVNPGLTLQ